MKTWGVGAHRSPPLPPSRAPFRLLQFPDEFLEFHPSGLANFPQTVKEFLLVELLTRPLQQLRRNAMGKRRSWRDWLGGEIS
jgi:hypothetical protein